MSIDIDKLTELALESRFLQIESDYGSNGKTALRTLLAGLKQLYAFIEPPTAPFSLTKFVAVDPQASTLLPGGTEISDTQTLAQIIRGDAAIEIRQAGGVRVWVETQVDIKALSQHALVYHHNGDEEAFYSKTDRFVFPRLIPSHSSNFAVPAFPDLRLALEWYSSRMARRSTCKLLKGIWFDDRRLFVKAGQPEDVMRDSLAQHLRSSLRGNLEVMPEQNVDESHPVDVRVSWLFCNRMALIEIKWLGDSLKSDRSNITVKHRDSRARDGAAQLADYLDKNSQSSPGNLIRGFLVVFDARRHGLKESTTSISKENGHYYESRDIDYDPKYHLTRDDFETPLRFFLEPVCA